ncbi:hypothetical protein HPP92_010181 [Vanilla planifolia]|uniref:Uncharacterized protein n=1 Tax=Vanilla planifolia TaxID=51239 RepID=A0A835R9Z6_VANPL|nr:hypothetical protein HPP92_010181 [Vanilla planifolia]
MEAVLPLFFFSSRGKNLHLSGVFNNMVSLGFTFAFKKRRSALGPLPLCGHFMRPALTFINCVNPN